MDLSSPQFAAYNANVRAHDDDPIRSPYWSDHSVHGEHPIFKHAGWGPGQPCGHVNCPQHNPEFSDRLYDAESARLHQTVDIKPEQHGLLRPLEAHIDVDTVRKYAAKDPGRPPIVADLPGYKGIHVLDGHHRFLGAQLAGRSIRVHVKSG